MDNSGVVNSEALSIEEYRKRINNYLDFLENELDHEAVMLTGSWVGTFEFNGETGTYPNSHRIRGNLGYGSDLLDSDSWDGKEDSPLRLAFEDSNLNALIGSIVLPKAHLSEECIEAVEESGNVTVPVNPEIEQESEAESDGEPDRAEPTP